MAHANWGVGVGPRIPATQKMCKILWQNSVRLAQQVKEQMTWRYAHGTHTRTLVNYLRGDVQCQGQRSTSVCVHVLRPGADSPVFSGDVCVAFPHV